jgi:DNA invertase Pin-like site-specific DNA recombinase
MIALASDKITKRHRELEAYVYVRQSTLKQVQQNQESRQNQYALVQRAIDLGWLPERVHLIDSDLGQSGQDRQRPGFQSLVAAVSLGQVGLILAYEASRLARNNTDWYTLLDLATVVGVLIADTEGIYDPRDYNDRLLLGLRGLLSEAELHTLRLRMDAGRRRQIEQGRYQQHVPTGLVRLEDGSVSKTPDVQVQQTIELVFARFTTLGSCQKVMRSLRDVGILLPRQQRGGLYAGQLLWRKPTQAALSDILHNPAYAGAFVYGRKGPHPDRRPGQLRQIRLPMEEWTTIQEASVSCIYYMGAVSGQSGATCRQCQRFRAASSWGSTTGLRSLSWIGGVWAVWLPDARDLQTAPTLHLYGAGSQLWGGNLSACGRCQPGSSSRGCLFRSASPG